MVGFSAGGLRFAVEAKSVVAMLNAGADAVNFAQLMGLTPQDAPTRVLALRQGDKVFPAVVEEPVVTRDIPYDGIRPLPALLKERLTKQTIRGLHWDEQGLVILVSL